MTKTRQSYMEVDRAARGALLVGALLLGVMASPAALAQSIDYKQRASDMTALSGIYGELHHIRRLCEPRREAEVWRDRMKRMIELEQPTPALQAQMVSAFNDGYRNAQGRFDRCDSRAEDYAAARAVDGGAAVARLAEPLYEAAASNAGDGPTIWRGTQGPVDADLESADSENNEMRSDPSGETRKYSRPQRD